MCSESFDDQKFLDGYTEIQSHVLQEVPLFFLVLSDSSVSHALLFQLTWSFLSLTQEFKNCLPIFFFDEFIQRYRESPVLLRYRSTLAILYMTTILICAIHFCILRDSSN
jgi:hypothetical protein